MFASLMRQSICFPATRIKLRRPMKLGVTLMRRKRPPFVELWRDRHGKIRCYFRKERGQRVSLPSNVGSDEFNASYQAALAGQLAPVRERHARGAAGTINALVI